MNGFGIRRIPKMVKNRHFSRFSSKTPLIARPFFGTLILISDKEIFCIFWNKQFRKSAKKSVLLGYLEWTISVKQKEPHRSLAWVVCFLCSNKFIYSKSKYPLGYFLKFKNLLFFRENTVFLALFVTFKNHVTLWEF